MTVYCDCAFARVVRERRIAKVKITERTNRRIAAPILESSRTAERSVTAEHESIAFAGRVYDFAQCDAVEVHSHLSATIGSTNAPLIAGPHDAASAVTASAAATAANVTGSVGVTS